jgi:hypothetical protein
MYPQNGAESKHQLSVNFYPLDIEQRSMKNLVAAAVS